MELHIQLGSGGGFMGWILAAIGTTISVLQFFAQYSAAKRERSRVSAELIAQYNQDHFLRTRQIVFVTLRKLMQYKIDKSALEPEEQRFCWLVLNQLATPTNFNYGTSLDSEVEDPGGTSPDLHIHKLFDFFARVTHYHRAKMLDETALAFIESRVPAYRELLIDLRAMIETHFWNHYKKSYRSTGESSLQGTAQSTSHSPPLRWFSDFEYLLEQIEQRRSRIAINSR